MRMVLAPLLTALALACGSSTLSRKEAERDIRQDYPVQLVAEVPETAEAAKASPGHAKLAALAGAVQAGGWFTVQRTEAGDQETFRFQPGATPPKNLQRGAKGWLLPAAEAEFVRAKGREVQGGEIRVAYEIRLVRPTQFFNVFQILHPGVFPGQTKVRHATYRKEGRAWILQGTDETLRKVR